jgi:hypothetical protein
MFYNEENLKLVHVKKKGRKECGIRGITSVRTLICFFKLLKYAKAFLYYIIC